MADLNDLQREWDSQPGYPEERLNEIAALVRTRSGSMRSTLFARDRREAIACVFIIVVFAAYWMFDSYWGTAPNAVAKTGIAIIIAGAVEIIVLMQVVQRRGRADFTSVPLNEFLLSEVQMLSRQIALLRHVVWWYLLPLYIGCCVFVIGIGLTFPGGRVFSIVFCLADFAFCAFLWWLNQSARKKTLEPLRDALQRTYDGLSALDHVGESVSDSCRSGDRPAYVNADTDLLDALADPALDQKCRPWVRFVRPSWRQIVLMVFAGMGGFFAGTLIQRLSGEPMRYEEWPLLGLIVAGICAVVSSCVRRTGKDE
jgi:hypothetical protein